MRGGDRVRLHTYRQSLLCANSIWWLGGLEPTHIPQNFLIGRVGQETNRAIEHCEVRPAMMKTTIAHLRWLALNRVLIDAKLRWPNVLLRSPRNQASIDFAQHDSLVCLIETIYATRHFRAEYFFVGRNMR